jgi:hypothetical protein
MSVTIYEWAGSHIPEDLNLQVVTLVDAYPNLLDFEAKNS